MIGLNDIGIGSAPRSNGAITRMGKDYFPDPWCDYAGQEMPRTLNNVLEWSEFVWLTNGTFRMACERVVRYFLTDVEIKDVSDDEADKYAKYLKDQIKVMNVLANLGDDMMCYGNSFSSVHPPFDRFLRCQHCRYEQPIERVNYKFTKNYEFKGKCNSCGKEGIFSRIDRRSALDDVVRIIRWNPHDIIIQYNPVTHDIEYRLRLDSSIKEQIRKGDEFTLRTTPWEIVTAIQEDKLFRFHKDRIYHMKEETLAGVKNAGWGIPRLISNFKQAYYIQVLKRYNEALALDYIVPFRVIHPAQSGGEMDPLLHQDANASKRNIMDMISEHRRDPATWHYLPFPIDYKALGGEGMQMATNELIGASIDEMLNAQGIPAELYKGSLQIQAAPTALRLFQQTWPHLVAHYNGWLQWLGQQLVSIKNWEPASIRMQPVTLADDLEKKQVLLQLASANIVSKQTALSPFGIDISEETRRVYEEQRLQQEQEREFQRDAQEQAQLDQQLEAMAQGGAGAAPGAPQMGGMLGGGGLAMPPGQAGMMGGGGMPAASGARTPQDMAIQAEQMAGQMLQVPYAQRRSMLVELKHTDPEMHALVKQKLEEMRNQAASQGQQMILQGAM